LSLIPVSLLVEERLEAPGLPGAQLFPFHCWPALQSPIFITFRKERGSEEAPARPTTRFTVGGELCLPMTRFTVGLGGRGGPCIPPALSRHLVASLLGTSAVYMPGTSHDDSWSRHHVRAGNDSVVPNINPGRCPGEKRGHFHLRK